MMLRKILAATTALALATTPLTASIAAPAAAPPAAEDVDGQSQFSDGFAAHWIVIGAVALAVLIFVVLDDGNEDPVSP